MDEVTGNQHFAMVCEIIAKMQPDFGKIGSKDDRRSSPIGKVMAAGISVKGLTR